MTYTEAELAFIQEARNQYASDEIEIDEEPKTSPSDEGCWVAAWVWVSNDEAGICRECGDPGADNGEGYDGLCGNCADKECECGRLKVDCTTYEEESDQHGDR